MKLLGARVLVTGGAGFIGSHLVEQLVASGAAATVIDDLSQGTTDNLAACLDVINFVQADVLSAKTEEIVASGGFDIVYHLASNAYVPPSVKDPQTDLNLNLMSTFRLLEVIRLKSPQTVLIYASSAAVYGDPQVIPIHESAQVDPMSPYGVSKLAAERYVRVYSLLYGIKAASLRFFSGYGPRQTKQVIYDFFGKLRGNPHILQVHGDGSQIRDFCYVDDIVRATLLVTEKGDLEGEVYNVASGVGCSISELVRLVCDVVGHHPPCAFSGHVRPGDPQRWVADISRLRALGYEPFVMLAEGVVKAYEWYLQNTMAADGTHAKE